MVDQAIDFHVLSGGLALHIGFEPSHNAPFFVVNVLSEYSNDPEQPVVF